MTAGNCYRWRMSFQTKRYVPDDGMILRWSFGTLGHFSSVNDAVSLLLDSHREKIPGDYLVSTTVTCHVDKISLILRYVLNLICAAQVCLERIQKCKEAKRILIKYAEKGFSTTNYHKFESKRRVCQGQPMKYPKFWAKIFTVVANTNVFWKVPKPLIRFAQVHFHKNESNARQKVIMVAQKLHFCRKISAEHNRVGPVLAQAWNVLIFLENYLHLFFTLDFYVLSILFQNWS